jgi:exopolyphosphatase/pppGpp-phosphohydrolase
LRIEVLGAPEGVNRDIVFLDLAGASLEIFFADKAEDFAEIVTASEYFRVEN